MKNTYTRTRIRMGTGDKRHTFVCAAGMLAAPTVSVTGKKYVNVMCPDGRDGSLSSSCSYLAVYYLGVLRANWIQGAVAQT